MKKCLLFLIAFSFTIFSFQPAYGESAKNTIPVSIKDALLVFSNADYEIYDIDQYIFKPNETIRLDDLEFTLLEAAADPAILVTNIMCHCTNPETELRTWYGFAVEEDEILAHVKESHDHDICYISISPDTPYAESVLDSAILDNNYYRWSKSVFRGRDHFEQNETIMLTEVFLIEMIRMHNGEWEKRHEQISFDIQVYPVIDRFEPFDEPVAYPEYDLIVEYGLYMTPIDFHVQRYYQSLTNQKLQYDFFIHCDLNELKLSEGLPETVLITIKKRDEGKVVHTEKWIRKNGIYVLED